MTGKNILPSPGDLHQLLPIQSTQEQFIQNVRNEIIDILEERDPRLLLIVGPCSVHDITAATEYAMNLRRLSQEVASSFLIIMRTYFEKPRTKLGWKGFLHDPDLTGNSDIIKGLHISRQLLLDLAHLEVPTATEFLDPASPEYYGDLIAWGCIGARTSSSQIHRQIASGLPMPIAFKNSTDGNIGLAIHGVQAASVGHTFIGMESSGRVALVHTKGNPHAHIMLRGGDNLPNYDFNSIMNAARELEKLELPARVLIDCSHDNCGKQAEKQADVFLDVIQQYAEGNNYIRGLMLESNLYSGMQTLKAASSLQLSYGVSITDPCIDWKLTESIIQKGHQLLKSR